eukprot:gene12755-biopygen9515
MLVCGHFLSHNVAAAPKRRRVAADRAAALFENTKAAPTHTNAATGNESPSPEHHPWCHCSGLTSGLISA